MNKKRKFPREKCSLIVHFNYFEGNPDEFEQENATPLKGKGYMINISRGGTFIITNSRVTVGLPIELKFETDKSKYALNGSIIRTGLVKNNPSETAQRLADEKIKGNTYIAIEFSNPFDRIPE